MSEHADPAASQKVPNRLRTLEILVGGKQVHWLLTTSVIQEFKIDVRLFLS